PRRFRPRRNGCRPPGAGDPEQAAGGGRGARVIARILLWSLFDSKTTLEELREKLPELPDGDLWLWNAASARFGRVSFAACPSASCPPGERTSGAISSG